MKKSELRQMIREELMKEEVTIDHPLSKQIISDITESLVDWNVKNITKYEIFEVLKAMANNVRLTDVKKFYDLYLND